MLFRSLKEVRNVDQEIRTNGKVQLLENWALLGSLRYDLEDDIALNYSVGLRFTDHLKDQCFALTVLYKETNYVHKDVTPDQSVMVQFDLKYLGSFGTTDFGALTSAVGD